MKVLVTGSEGYIGTRLMPLLVEAGLDVVGLDTGFYSEAWLYDFAEADYPLLKKDIRKLTPADLQGFDAVIHLAELSNDPIGEMDPNATYEINHFGTVHLAKLAKQAGVERFVYASSCAVYGAAEGVCDETSAPNPMTLYAKCKVLNERALQKMADEDFCPVVLRNATVYGPSPRMRFCIVVNNLAGLAWTTNEVKMKSNGEPYRPLVHILDVCQALLAALKAPRKSVYNQIFNIGNTRSNYQIKGIAKLIGQKLPHATITLNESSVDKRDYQVSFDKAKTSLPGFASQTTLEAGISELIEFYKKINLDEATFRSPMYNRLAGIKSLFESSQLDNNFYWVKSKVYETPQH